MWYEIKNIDELDTPALIVYPDRVRENIRLAIEMVGDAGRLRPHVKTHKSPAVTRLMLEAGIRQFKCATIAEAEMLAAEGAPDVLLAYQPVGPKVRRLVGLIRKFPATRFACLIDQRDAAAAMAGVFRDAGLVVPVFLDLNVGMDRTGITPGPAALALYREALRLDGIAPVGLHAYDGHIRDSDPEQRRQKCDAAFSGVLDMQAAMAAVAAEAGRGAIGGLGSEYGHGGMIIVAGGSPTFPIHARRSAPVLASWSTPILAGWTAPIQCSPGTFVYWDKGYSDQFPDQPFSQAALVVTRVVSQRSATRFCLDLGHKSIAPENELGHRVFFLNGPGLKPLGQSEEHLVVEVGANHEVMEAGASHEVVEGVGQNETRGSRIGDVFYGAPFHICPTVAQYERAFTVEDGRLTGEWRNTARDRILTV